MRSATRAHPVDAACVGAIVPVAPLYRARYGAAHCLRRRARLRPGSADPTTAAVLAARPPFGQTGGRAQQWQYKGRLWFGRYGSGAMGNACKFSCANACVDMRILTARAMVRRAPRWLAAGPITGCGSALRACCPRLITRRAQPAILAFLRIRALRTDGQMRFRAASAPSAAGNAGTAPFADACGPHPSFSSFRSRRPGNRRSHLPRTARQKPARAGKRLL